MRRVDKSRRPVSELDAETQALAQELGTCKTISLKTLSKLLIDNLVHISDTVLELDALMAQLEGYITLVDDAEYTQMVEEAKLMSAHCTALAEEWEQKRDALDKTLKVGDHVRTDEMSSLLEGSLIWRAKAKKMEYSLRHLRLKGKSILMEHDRAREVNRRMLRLADSNVMDPYYSALLQSQLLNVMITRKRKQCVAEGTSLDIRRMKQFKALLLQICENLRLELKEILKQVCVKVSKQDYCLDEAQNLTHRIPQHLASLDDLISLRDTVIDAKIEQYVDEILQTIRAAAEECQDQTLDGKAVPKYTIAAAASEDGEQNEMARLRNKMYADFAAQFNWGDLPFPPLLKKSRHKNIGAANFSPREPSLEEHACLDLETPPSALPFTCSLIPRRRSSFEGLAEAEQPTELEKNSSSRNRLMHGRRLSQRSETMTTVTTSINLNRLKQVPGYNPDEDLAKP